MSENSFVLIGILALSALAWVIDGESVWKNVKFGIKAVIIVVTWPLIALATIFMNLAGAREDWKKIVDKFISW